MKIALAQIQPKGGDVDGNVAKHLGVIHLAVEEGADAIFFPELSLSGYEPSLARALACELTDARLEVFQQFSNDHQLLIAIGLPLKSANEKPFISMLFFQPDQPRSSYTKQFLHTDERPFFTAEIKPFVLNYHGVKIAPAICYESLVNHHIEGAYERGGKLYVVSAAKSHQNLIKAYAHYAETAKDYNLPLLLCNSLGPCDNFYSNGQSAAWNRQGQLVASLNEPHEGILLYDTQTEQGYTKYLGLTIVK